MCRRNGMILIVLLALTLVTTGCEQTTTGEMPGTYRVNALPGVSTDSLSPTPPANHTLRLLRPEPTVAALAVGELCTTQIWLDNAQELYSIELVIAFDPLYVSVVDADPFTPGVQVSAGTAPMPNQPVINEVDNNTGVIRYKAVQPTGRPGSGSGIVLSFTAQALHSGGSPLRFTSIVLQDASGNVLPAPEFVDGLVLINSQGDETTHCIGTVGSS
ncbi:MAG: cohesin domain-containing protein [Anaerolineae bacterium]|nr:cohesin domain-containing protein [Anaerolineae bacterium]